MTGPSPFGVRLWRLLSHRGSTTSVEFIIGNLARAAGVPGAHLKEIVKGAEPSPDLLRRLGPPLGIHLADMFAIAALPVPPDLASAWPTAPLHAGAIVRWAIGMSPEGRGRMNELIRSMPVEPRSESAPVDDPPDGPGAMLLRLLRNRNIRPGARILAEIGGGPYVSDSTVAMLGTGRVVITPQYVTAFAHLLGYAPGDMVALTGVGPVFEDAPAHPASDEIAALAWSARRLGSDQIECVLNMAGGYLTRGPRPG